MLERLELTGALVTIGCQRGVAEAIRDHGADYLLALKDNWPAEEVGLFFEREPQNAFDTCNTTDGDHGRIGLRRHCVSHVSPGSPPAAAFPVSRASRDWP